MKTHKQIDKLILLSIISEQLKNVDKNLKKFSDMLEDEHEFKNRDKYNALFRGLVEVEIKNIKRKMNE